jgi:hypothetical protein
MRIKGSCVKGVLIALGIALIPLTAVAAENVAPASACKVLNQKVVYQNKTYTCIKSGKKLIWNKGVAVAVTTPVNTSTPIATPTSSPTPNPTSAESATQTTSEALETPSPAATCSRNRNALRNC